ncbi:MAG: hypothetical protein J1E81_02150 [Eubacterium sp.]|nr:hypothetical protein [Eubacterium sp.]
MRTSKKLLSFFLAVVMVVTTCSVGITAFAQDNSKSIWTTDAKAQDAFDALNSLADDLLPGVLLGIDVIGGPICDKYAKNNPEKAKQLYAQYAKANGTKVSKLTDEEKRAAVKDAAAEVTTLSEALAGLQPMLIPLINSAAGSIAGGEVIYTDQQSFVNAYYPGYNPSNFDYLNTDNALSYYAIISICDTYANSDLLTSEEKATLKEWKDALLPLSELGTSIEKVINKYGSKFNAENPNGVDYRESPLSWLEDFDFAVEAEDKTIIDGLCKGYNAQLKDYGISASEINIDGIDKILYYYYGAGINDITTYRYRALITSTGNIVDVHGGIDPIGLGVLIPVDVDEDVTPANCMDLLFEPFVEGINKLQIFGDIELTVDGLIGLLLAGDPNIELDDETRNFALESFRPMFALSYLTQVLPLHYKEALAGIAMKEGKVSSYDEFLKMVKATLPNGKTGVDASIFSKADLKSLGLAVNATNVQGKEAEIADSYFAGKTTNIDHLNLNYDITLPAVLKGTATADYFRLITGYPASNDYMQNLRSALIPSTDSAFETEGSSLIAGDDGLPIIKEGYEPDLAAISEYMAAAEEYAYSMVATSLTGIQGSIADEVSNQNFIIDIVAYLDSTATSAVLVNLTDKQKDILNNTADLTNQIGTKILNELLNTVVVKVIGMELLGQTVEDMVNSLLSTRVDLTTALSDVWSRLINAPIATIVELVPVLVVAIDELILPLVIHGEGDEPPLELFGIFSGSIIMKFLPEAGSEIGITRLAWDLNELLPNVLHWLFEGSKAQGIDYYDFGIVEVKDVVTDEDGIQNFVSKRLDVDTITGSDLKHYFAEDQNGNKLTRKDVNGVATYTYMGKTNSDLATVLEANPDAVFTLYMEYESNVPVLTGIYIADKALRDINISDIPGMLVDALGDNTLGNILGEVITEIATLLKESIDIFVSDPALVGAERYSTSGSRIGTGLNNVFVAIPQLFDIMEDLAAEKYGIAKNAWTYCYEGKIISKDMQDRNGKDVKTTLNTDLETLKAYAGSDDPNRSVGIFDAFAGIFVEDWLNAIFSLLNNVISTDNQISNNLPIIAGLLNALGGLGEDSIITDLFNGVFQIEREDDISFTFAKRANGLTGLSKDHAYFLIANIDTLIEVITGLIDNINGGASISGDSLVGNTKKASSKAPTIKNAKANSKTYTKKELSNAEDLINNLDKLVASLLSDSTLNDFSLNSTSNILAGAVSFLSRYIGNDCYTELGNLLDKYLYYITGKDTHKADSKNNVDAKKVYTNDSLTGLMVETFLLIENVVENLFGDFTTTHKLANGSTAKYNLIAEAIEGIISPDAICVRLDGYEKVAKQLTKYNCWHNAAAKTSRGNYKISLDWGIKAGDKDAFFNAFAASLRLVTSILGVVLVDTGWYGTVLMPILSALAEPNGIKVDTAKQYAKLTNGYHDEVLLGLMAPISGWLDSLLTSPVSTLIRSIQGIAGILDDDSTPTIASILKGALAPINKELTGLAKIFTIKSSKLVATSPTLAKTIKNIAKEINKYSDVKNIKISGYTLCGKNIIPIVNTLLADTGIQLKQISWSKLANAETPAAALVYLLDYLLETLLDSDTLTALAKLINNDVVTMIIDALKAGKITSSDILELLNKVLEVTDSPTLVYWTFAQYLQELTEKFAYPKGVTKAMADSAVTQLDDAIGSVLKLLGSFGVDLGATDLQGIISKNLFKNELITTIATALYGALDGLDPTIKNALKGLGIVSSTKDIANILTDKSYGKTYTSAANTIKAQSDWSKVKNVNWGFKDGSDKAQQGFVNALAAVLRPLSGVLAVFLNEGTLELNNVVYELIMSLEVKTTKTTLTISDGDVPIKVNVSYQMKNGVFTATFKEDPSNRKDSKNSELKLDLTSLKDVLTDLKIEGTNAYNSAIIPLLEALGCENIKTYKQYQSDVASAKDNLLLDILNPLVGDNSKSFLNKLAANPISELTKLLPNIAMYLDAHGLAQFISNLLAPVTQLVYEAVDTLKLDDILEDILGMPLGDLVGGLIGLDEGVLNLDISDLTTLNIEDVIIPIVNMILASQSNENLSKLQLQDIDWNALISLGTKGTYTSKATDAKGNFLTGKIVKNVDQGKVLVTVLRYVANTLVANAKVLKNLICSIDAIAKNDMLKSIIQSIFTTIGSSTGDQIVAAVFYLLAGRPANAFWDYSSYETGTYSFSYPEGIDVDFLKNLPPMLDGLIGSLLDLNETIAKALYKDDIISKLVTGLYGAVEGVKVGDGTLTELLAQTDIDFSTENVANLLVNEKYGQKFESAASVIRSAGSWKNVSADSLKWGVTDRDSFMHALVAALRPIYGVLDVLLNSASLGIFNIVRIPGSNGYTASIVPLLEAFSCYNVKTQYQYREDILEEYDAILLDIINPLWDKVEDILSAPLQTVAAMIPNLALFIGNDGLCQIINNLLTPISALLDAMRPIVDVNEILDIVLDSLNVDLNSILGKVGITNLNIDIYDIFETLKPVLGADNIVPLLNSVLGLIKIKDTPLGIKLNDIDWLQLASHGKTIVSASQAATYGARIFVEGDSSETLIAVLRYLIVTINTGDNYKNISSLIGGLIGGADDSISEVVNSVLNELQGDTDKVIASLIDLLQTLGS